MSGIAERLAEVTREVPIGPFGPNAREIINRGGRTYLTGTEADAFAQALLPVVEREIAAARGEVVARVEAECLRFAQAADEYDQAQQWEYAGGLREAAHHIRAALSPDPDRGEGCSCGHGWEYHGPEVPGCCECDCGVLRR